MIALCWMLACLAAAEPRKAAAIDVPLGKEFRLAAGATARLPGGKAKLRIKRFVNSPCPKGAQCVWSGQDVIFELTVDGKAVRLEKNDSPYEVTLKESDYRTFAVFIVDEPELACGRLEPPSGAECLRSLAVRRNSPALCRSIEDPRTRGLCLEDLAENLTKPELCREVSDPSQYCLYARSKTEGNLAACDGIVQFRWRVRCFKELNASGRSCSALNPQLAKRCREYVAGADE